MNIKYCLNETRYSNSQKNWMNMSLSQVPLNDLSRLDSQLKLDVLQAVERVVNSGRFIFGVELETFESLLSNFLGAKFTIGVGNGTDALTIAIKSLSLPANHHVATVANAGGYATTAILNSGGSPVYVDVNPDDHLMSKESLQEAFALNPTISCVIVTHLYGAVAEVEDLKKICVTNGAYLIEDCAQALGSRYGEKMVGSLGDVATFSFFPTKNLGGFGDGGALVTSSPEVSRMARQLRQYGWEGKYKVEIPGGANSRLDEMQAAILALRLPNVSEEIKIRSAIADRYENALTGSSVVIPTWSGKLGHSHHLAVLEAKDRDQLSEALNSRGISTDVHYPVLDYDQSPWSNHKLVELPISEQIVRRIITIPCFASMHESEIEQVEVALQEITSSFE